MKKQLVAFCVVFLGISGGSIAAGDPDAGKAIATSVCAACHGADGNSSVGMYPKIAGQHEQYLVTSIKEYQKADKGGRNNPIMYESIKNLSEQDVANVAAYFSAQEQTANGAVEDLVPLGQAIYTGGNQATGVPACLACHGPSGDGNGPARFPRIAGQQVDYLVSQLKAFRSGERKDIIGNMMNDVAQKMSDDEINAVASFVAGLHSDDLERFKTN